MPHLECLEITVTLMGRLWTSISCNAQESGRGVSYLFLRMQSPIDCRRILVFLAKGDRYYTDVLAPIIWPLFRRLEAQRKLLTYVGALFLLTAGISYIPNRGDSIIPSFLRESTQIHIPDSQSVDSFPNGDIAKSPV